MECVPADRLSEFAAGEASDDAGRAIEAHIDECDDCRRALSSAAGGQGPAASFGRYHLDGVLGSGGMGIVYGGFDPQLKRAVAIKVVRRAEDDAGRQRLVREAQSLARLSHRHVCQVYDVGTDGDEVWVAMEKIDGVTLREWARRPLRAGELLAVLADAGEGLAAAHAAGLVHRDVKPENVLVARDGRAVVTDFGLARVDVPVGAVGGDAVVSTLAGTPAYLAPEQLAGLPIDARVDQFAFAVMAWELLTGTRPFAPGAGLAAVRAGVTPPPGLARPIATALRRALAADPADRFPSMAELITALRPRASRRRRIAMTAAALVVVGGGAAWFGLAHRGDDPAAACARGADKVHAVWGPPRAVWMRGELLATRASFAADTADRVVGLLDAFATRYRTETVAACQTTFASGSASQHALDVQRACLDHGLERVEQLLGVFAHADRAMVGLAINATYAVTDLDACRDVPLMLVRQDEPADPRVRASIAALRTTLARAEVLDAAGDPKHALPIAQEVATAADAIPYFPLRADAAYRIAIVQRELGAPALADDALRRTITAAESGRDDLLAAGAWVRLMGAARTTGDFAEAERRSDQAKAKLERLDNPPEITAYWLLAHAQLLQARDQLAAARSDAERALVLYEPFGVERPRIVSGLGLLANIYAELGLHELQLHTAERAEALAEKLRGPDHPMTAEALGQLGDAEAHSGAHAKALATFQRALAIQTRVYGADSVIVSGSLNQIAGAQAALGDHAGAEASVTRALEIRVKKLGADHPSSLSTETNLATLLTETRPADAIAHLEHVLAVRQAKTPDSTDVGLVVAHIGDAQHAAGDHVAARASYQRALAIFTAKLGPTHPRVAMEWSAIGSLDVDTAPAAAIAPLEHAIAIDDRGEREPGDAAGDRLLLARALWDSNRDRPRARAQAMAAHDALAHADADPVRVAEVEAWLRAHKLE